MNDLKIKTNSSSLDSLCDVQGNLSFFSFFSSDVFEVHCAALLQHTVVEVLLKVGPFVFQIPALALGPTRSRSDPVQPAMHLAAAVTVRGSEMTTTMMMKATRQENPA